jgi:undecaprenyl-diphosphatase
VDWSLAHTINVAVATRDWLEDPFTLLVGPMIALYAAATVGLWFFDRPYGELKWKLACTSALASAALAMLMNQLIAHFIWDRARPYTAHPAADQLLSAPSPDPSFPSDHATAAFAIAFAVLAFSRRCGIVFLVVATLIGLSRVALGMHYPSDVLAGLFVGWLASILVTRAARSLVLRLVTLVSRISDPLLRPFWDRIPRRRLLSQ